jgi:ribosomal protein L35AE/L33A
MIKVGSRIAWIPESGGKPVIGTVRKIAGNEARVDDGDPENPDLRSNGFHVAVIVRLSDLTEIT